MILRIILALCLLPTALAAQGTLTATSLMVGSVEQIGWVMVHRMTPLPLAGGANSTVAAIKASELPQYEDWVDVVKVFDQGTTTFREECRRIYQGVDEYNDANGTTMRAALMAGGLSSGAESYMGPIAEELIETATYAPAQFYVGAAPYFSAYSTNAVFWDVVDDIETRTSLTLYVQPHFQWRQGFSGPVPGPYTPDWANGETTGFTNGSNNNNMIWLATHQDNARADGFSLWDFPAFLTGTYGVTTEIATFRTISTTYGKTMSAMVTAGQKGYPHKGNSSVLEGFGFERLVASWEAAIDAAPEYVEYLTANDMSESSYFVDWPSSSLGYTDAPYVRNHWNVGDNSGITSHRAFREISAYFAHRFRYGTYPSIPDLKVYYAYIPHPRDAVSYSALSSGDQTDMTEWLPDSQQGNETLKNNIYQRSASYTNYCDGVHVALLVPSGVTVHVYIEGEKVIDGFAGPGFVQGRRWGETEATGQTDWGASNGTSRYTFSSQDVTDMSDGPEIEVRAANDVTVLVAGHGKLPFKPWRYTQGNYLAYELQDGDTAITTPPED